MDMKFHISEKGDKKIDKKFILLHNLKVEIVEKVFEKRNTDNSLRPKLYLSQK